MKMMKCSIAAIALAASQLAAASGGDTWRYTGAGYKKEAFSQAEYWTDNDGQGNQGVAGAPLEPDDYYLVENWKVLYSAVGQAANTTYTFGGKRLTLGEVDKKAGYMEAKTYTPTTILLFPNDGLYLANGWIKANGYQFREHPINGTMTVVSPASSPFILGGYVGYTNMTLTINAALVGASTVGLRVSDTIQGATTTNLTVKLAGNCTEYEGSIMVTSVVKRTEGRFGAALSLGDISMPGSVTVGSESVLRTVTKTTIATVGSLTLGSGSCIALQADIVNSKMTNGFFRVTGDFAAAGPVTVTLPAALRSKAIESHVRFPIVEVPLGATISTDDFVMAFSDGISIWPNEWFRFKVEKGTTSQTLVLEFELALDPVVRLMASDKDTYSPGYDSSLTNAANWSSLKVPEEGYHYLVEKGYAARLRTISNTTLDYDFKGDSLTFRNANFFIFCRTFTVPLLRVCSGSVATGSKLPYGVVRADRFEFGGETVNLTVQIDGLLELDGPICGPSTLVMNGNHTYGSNGKVWLHGMNTNFTGKLKMSVGSATPNDTDIFQTLYVSDGRNLGGARESFAYDALALDAYALLCTTNAATVTLADGLNRGLYVTRVGRIRTDAGQTLAVEWPLTLNGTLRKEGEGNLLLGGTALFTPVGGVPAALPMASSNIVVVKAGGIGVTSAESLNGMELQFEPGAKLVCKADLADADLRARGLVNTKAATPFAVLGGLEKIPVEVVSDVQAPSANQTLAIATVPAGSAASVMALMGQVKAPSAWRGFHAKWNAPAVDAVAGTATLSVLVKRTGLQVSIR